MHIVIDCDYKEIKSKVKMELEKHGISHTTIEFEDKNEKCDSEKCEITNKKHTHHHHHHH